MSIRILSSELQKKSEEELNEIPKRVREDLKHIREWLAKQPHLNVRKDDQWLLSFLRGCKFSLQRTKEKLDTFYTMRSMLPEFYTNRDPFLPEIQQVLEVGLFLPLPKTVGPDGSRIMLLRCERVDPNTISFINAVKTSLMIIDILLNEDDNFIIAGQLGFMDLKGMTINHAVQATPTLCKKIVMCLQDAYPTRPKGLLSINTPYMFKTIYDCMKPFVKTKILKRIHFYKEKDIDKLYDAIPLSVLPKEYGGDGGALDKITSHWKNKVESYRDWFLEDANYYVDETKRLGEPQTSDGMFGIAGSFRKLDID